MVYMGVDLPLEYAGSNDTFSLKGQRAKAKANAVQGLPEMIMIAWNRSYKENHETKHRQDAKYGWRSHPVQCLSCIPDHSTCSR